MEDALEPISQKPKAIKPQLLVKKDSCEGWRIDLMRQVICATGTRTEYTTVEFGFSTEALALERSIALGRSAGRRRAKFRLVIGGKA